MTGRSLARAKTRNGPLWPPRCDDQGRKNDSKREKTDANPQPRGSQRHYRQHQHEDQEDPENYDLVDPRHRKTREWTNCEAQPFVKHGPIRFVTVGCKRDPGGEVVEAIKKAVQVPEKRITFFGKVASKWPFFLIEILPHAGLQVLEVGNERLELEPVDLVDRIEVTQRIDGGGTMDVPGRSGVDLLLGDVPGLSRVELRAVGSPHAKLRGLSIPEHAQPLANVELKLRGLPDRRPHVIEREKPR